MKVAALDYETYYDKEVSVRTLGTVNYCRHPLFKAYMITIVTSTGHEFVGRPEDFDYRCINGPEWTWLSHNASFDHQVYLSLMEKEAHKPEAARDFPAPPKHWECTADLCAYMNAPRALAGAAHFFYGLSPDKSVRDKMKGRMPEELTGDEYQELKNYALDDSRICLRFWQDFGHLWPEVERRTSWETRKMAWHGVPLDLDGVKSDIKKLQNFIWLAERDIPWEGPKLSPKNLAILCRENGIPCPKSLAMDDEECAKWEDEYGEKYPWVAAMRNVRRGNMILKKLESMVLRTTAEGRLSYDIKYAGTHTLRWSGAEGLNMQNLSGKALLEKEMESLAKRLELTTQVPSEPIP